MSYATVVQFINQFRASRVAELIDTSTDNNLTSACLLAVATGEDTAEFTSEDIAAANDGIALINVHLNDSAKQINSYLIINYHLPLGDEIIASSPLVRIQNDITRYLIASTHDLMSDIIEAKYKDAMKFLKDVSSGKASLSLTSNVSTNVKTATAGIKVTTGQAVDLRGY